MNKSQTTLTADQKKLLADFFYLLIEIDRRNKVLAVNPEPVVRHIRGALKTHK